MNFHICTFFNLWKQQDKDSRISYAPFYSVSFIAASDQGIS